MSRLFQTGAEMGTGIELGTTYSTSYVTSSFHTGDGSAYSYKFPLSGTTVATNSQVLMGFPDRVDSKTALYYKSDIYIDDLENSTEISFQPLRMYNGSGYTTNLHIYNSGGTLRLMAKANATNTAQSSGTTIDDVALGVGFDTWFRLEIFFDSRPADGAEVYEVKVNGSTVISSSTLTYTVKTASEHVMALVNTSVTNARTGVVYVDNISFNDVNGSHNNTWIGEEYIVAVMPDGAGDSNPSAGTYASINEIPATATATSTANRIELNVSNNAGWFTLSNGILSNVLHTINAVTAPILIREASAGTSAYNVGIKSQSSGREWYANSLYYPDLNYTMIGGFDAGNATNVRRSPNGTTEYGLLLISEVDPTTGVKWKPTGTNSIANAQIGVRYSSAGSVDLWASWFGAMVAYTPKPPTDARGMLIMFW